ncbi:hypothetical protein STAQ_31630 [Allostella sp. ATCC 35155]|nr:hypothetical protein STAQ_31630 [Stella sp. ATCC 35155]
MTTFDEPADPLRPAPREAKRRALKAALDAGEVSGEPEPFDMDEFIEEMRAEHPRHSKTP